MVPGGTFAEPLEPPDPLPEAPIGMLVVMSTRMVALVALTASVVMLTPPAGSVNVSPAASA
jgi:hypothetical protein